MEYIIDNKTVLEQLPALSPNGVPMSSSTKPFIEANTIEMPIKDLKDQHIIPVWTATNEPLISHVEFIESTWEIAHRVFKSETILKPNIRVSHPIKGRIPEAKHKPSKDLEPWEETIYYERMMFVIEIPTIIETIGGNSLSLTIGGVKSYGMDNLNTRRHHGSQSFQLFIGFQNRVCCNLCVSTDGYKLQSMVKNTEQLKLAIENLYYDYNVTQHVRRMKSMQETELSETEFAQIIGRSRMYRHMPEKAKPEIPPLMLGDQQMGAVVQSFYHDEDFGNPNGGNIQMWDFYNLLTGANKSTYIDGFLERSVNAGDFALAVGEHKGKNKQFWYMG